MTAKKLGEIKIPKSCGADLGISWFILNLLNTGWISKSYINHHIWRVQK